MEWTPHDVRDYRRAVQSSSVVSAWEVKRSKWPEG